MRTNKTILCNTCNFNIPNKILFLSCINCNLSHHAKCVNYKFKKLSKSFQNPWMCSSCVNTIFPFYSLSNNELYDMFNTCSLKNFSSSDLNSIYCDESLDFSFNDSNNQINSQLPLSDQYYSIQELNSQALDNSSNFTTMCVNVRSLINPRNFSKFESLVTALHRKPDIIAINETWERYNMSGEYNNLKGYVYVSNPRLVAKGGGCGLFIRNN